MTETTGRQRRGRRIAMTAGEIDDFLTGQRTCRVATVGADGPHATPLWFGWDSACLWLYSIVRSRRWADLMKDPRVSAVIDAGSEYAELRGVEICGTARVIGEVPRVGTPDAELAGIERQFARKYLGGEEMLHDERHGWLRIEPIKIISWDFRKLAAPGSSRSGHATPLG